MTSYLLAASVALLAYLSLYGLIFVLLGLAGLFLRRRPAATLEAPRGDQGEAVVLIPAYNEGEGLLDAVIAVSKQDYTGYVEIRILLNDKQDSSLEPLLNFYNLDRAVISEAEGAGQEGIILRREGRRRVCLVLTGCQTKKDKFNLILPDVAAPYVAFLDADHRPSPNWLSSSLGFFRSSGGAEEEVAGVQTRRRPLDTGHLAQIWDSSQNHLGNELVNRLLSGRSVFFTGTAAVFKTDILKRFPLSDSITEDTYLSYDLWCAGYRIAYNDTAASYEEVAPSFLAYISRRRRWSAGHNQTFFSHLAKIFKAKLSLRVRLVLLFHGQFYLVPLAVWLLLAIYGLYFFRQLADNLQLAITIGSFFLSFLLAYAFRQKGRSWLRLVSDWLIALLWILPQLAILSVYVYKLIGAEAYYYILVFPYAHDWLYWHFALVAAPLFALLGAWFFFRDSRRWLTLWVVPTYILTLFLDIYAALLGLADYAAGRAYWSKIERRNRYSASLVPVEVSGSLVTGRAVRGPKKAVYFLALFALVTGFFVNEFLAVNNCGEVKPFLWRPLLFQPDFSLDLGIEIDKKMSPDNNLRVRAQARLIEQGTAQGPEELVMKTFLDGELIEEKTILPGLSDILDREYPLGWEKHELGIEIEGRGIGRLSTCGRDTAFSTTLRELRGNDLYINDEKFLIKGVIPSFSSNQINLDMDYGLKQIKEIGANTVRFYHGANERLLDQAEAAGLLIIDQPDRSTWDELDLTSNFQVGNYLGRYRKLVKEHEGEPFILWDGLGNEWELGSHTSPGRAITLVTETLKTALNSADNPLTSYSTYYTFIKYPVDISGINMLDTGRTYWVKALDLVRQTNKPFYASEFGGFVAFWEKTDPELRMYRLQAEWETLIASGALGANFYQSHDNWAQPVVIGYNDPWKPEQPDDLRGFWDEKNQPKSELAVLVRILSDFRVTVSGPIADPREPITVLVENIRPYLLSGVKMEAGQEIVELGDFSLKESKEVEYILTPEEARARRLALRFSYTTHSGLEGVSRVELVLPLAGSEPLILNDDFIVSGSSAQAVTGRLLSSARLRAILPDSWERFSLNGTEQENSRTVLNIALDNPYRAVDGLEVSRDGTIWTPFRASQPAGGGVYYLRFRWPKLTANKQLLIVGGAGAGQIEIIHRGSARIWPSHNYRENAIDAVELGSPVAGELVTIRLDRQQAAYIDQRAIKNDLKGVDIALEGNMLIDLEAPRIFAPSDIDLRRVN